VLQELLGLAAVGVATDKVIQHHNLMVEMVVLVLLFLNTQDQTQVLLLMSGSSATQQPGLLQPTQL
jgi:hypothetical protein